VSGHKKCVVSPSIREVRSHEVKSVAEIHALALPNDFLPSLGVNPLEEYYAYSLELGVENKAKLLGAFEGERLVGFCQIAFDSISFTKIIKVNTLPSLFYSTVFRPQVAMNGLIQYFHAVRFNEGGAEIAFIAVAPACQRSGIGSMLISVAMEESREKKINWITTKTANKNLSLYYQKELKAQVIKRFSAVGQKYEILKWAVTP